MSDLWLATYVLLWAVVVVQALFLLGVLRQLGVVQLRLGSDPGALITGFGLPRGSTAPDFELDDALNGQRRRLRDFLGRGLAVTFLSPTCILCKQLIPHLNGVYREYGGDTGMLVVCHGTHQGCAEFARLFRINPPVVIDMDGSVARSFGVQGYPFTYVLDGDGRVLIRGIANDWTQLEALLREEGTLQGEDGSLVFPAAARKSAEASPSPSIDPLTTARTGGRS